MAGKKRPSASMEEGPDDRMEEPVASTPSSSKMSEKLKQMERRKARKALDKERRRLASEGNQKSESKSESNADEQKKESESKQVTKEPGVSVASTSMAHPGLHLDLFRGLSSQESSVREEAAERLVRELRDVQRSYEESNGENGEPGDLVKMEAKKDDGMENCAPSLRYAIRRFIRGVSSSREVRKDMCDNYFCFATGFVPGPRMHF